MSHENVEFVRGVYAEWESGNFRAGVERYDPEAVLVQSPVQRSVGKGRGAPSEFRYFQVWTFRNGKVIRLEVIRDRDSAFAAAG